MVINNETPSIWWYFNKLVSLYSGVSPAVGVPPLSDQRSR